MMNIEIKTGNAAFRGPDGEENMYYETMEIARLLRELAEDIENNYDKTDGSLNDYNGNRVLTWHRN